jgi:hypothetical protein
MKIIYNALQLFDNSQIIARMVESVDTRDLKSLALWVCEFKSRSGHQFQIKASHFVRLFFYLKIIERLLKLSACAKMVIRSLLRADNSLLMTFMVCFYAPEKFAFPNSLSIISSTQIQVAWV